MVLYTSLVGNNDFLISEISKLYLQDGDKIADITFGKGVFWRKIDTSKYDCYFSDLITCPNFNYDFRYLPYEDNSFNTVVFDPPYVHNAGPKFRTNQLYQNRQTTKGFYHKDIIDLYKQGMVESYRILKPKGYLWVKCKDEIESGIQRLSHIEIIMIGLMLGFYVMDLFVLTQFGKPTIQFKQKHARKNHSFMIIFKKDDLKPIIVQKNDLMRK